MEPQSFKWVLDLGYLCAPLHVAALLAGILSFPARGALNRSCNPPPCRAPVGDTASRINLSVFAGRKREMFRAALWIPIRPVSKSRQSRRRERNWAADAVLRLALRDAQDASLQIYVFPSQGANLL